MTSRPRPTLGSVRIPLEAPRLGVSYPRPEEANVRFLSDYQSRFVAGMLVVGLTLGICATSALVTAPPEPKPMKVTYVHPVPASIPPKALAFCAEQIAAGKAGVRDRETLSRIIDRINAYLRGTPLQGQGETFAREALARGVDPRISPAIACIESGKGSHNAGAHNAWGMRAHRGWQSFPNWEAGIRANIAILPRRLTNAYGNRYCPSNRKNGRWFANVSREMSRI